MRIVLDTNILVSAMGWDGNERKVLLATLSGDIDLVLSDEIISELLHVLS
jgi:predicted nucleic acid-binding protein